MVKMVFGGMAYVKYILFVFNLIFVMVRNIRLAPALLLSLFLLSVKANSHVHIMSKSELVTSNTLNWLPQSDYNHSQEIVIGGFLIVEKVSVYTQRRIFVCRALHYGVLVTGGLKEGEKRCFVTSMSSERHYEKYDLLQNTERASRVKWVSWYNHQNIPVGAVASSVSGFNFVARHMAEEVTEDSIVKMHFIGTLNAYSGRISRAVSEDVAKGSVQRGEVLVEMEPVRYNLNSVEINANEIRETKRIPKVLGTATLKNTGSKFGRIWHVFTYSHNYSRYWGLGYAIVKGLNTSITLSNETKLPGITWGTPEKKLIVETKTLFYLLEPGMAVNVTLVASYITTETSYTANLEAVYDDHRTKDRIISGFLQEEAIGGLDVEFSPVYFFQKSSLAPTSVPSPTNTTTTTKSTTRAAESILMTKEISLMEGSNQETVNQSMITQPRKSDGSKMQNDDGGPLSVKKKIEGDGSSGQSFAPCLLTIAVSFCLRLSITMWT